MKLLISACLLGASCRYDGKSKLCEKVLALREKHELIPVCPEQLGGLSTPRPPSERQGEGVMNKLGEDVTRQYRQGAEEALRLGQLLGCDAAILKARSPACGCHGIYDGTFSGTLRPGMGVAAEMLARQGMPVFSEEDDLNQLEDRIARIKRIQQMEGLMEQAEAGLAALRQGKQPEKAAQQALAQLDGYYSGPLWQQDFDADAAGILPADLKRGVLSEDGLWNLLEEWNELVSEAQAQKEE